MWCLTPTFLRNRFDFVDAVKGEADQTSVSQKGSADGGSQRIESQVYPSGVGGSSQINSLIKEDSRCAVAGQSAALREYGGHFSSRFLQCADDLPQRIVR
jgi:hypothetical protein